MSQYTVRNAMLSGIAHTLDETLTMDQLDEVACVGYEGVFERSTGRRVAQELTAEGVLTRVRRGLYRVNRKVLAKKTKAL